MNVWQRETIGSKFVITARPRGRDVLTREQVPFLPMDMLPTERLEVRRFDLRAPDDVRSGTYFEEGDLLVSKITPCFENGKQAIARDVPGGWGIATTEAIPLRPISVDAHLPFLAYYLFDSDVRQQLASKMEGATGRQRLPKEALLEFPLLIPPLPEQRAIAGVLGRVQGAVEVQERIVAGLRELKAATMAKLFREGLRGERLKQTEIGEIPESWEVVSIGEVARVSTGTTPATNRPDYYSGSIPFVKTTDIDQNIISSTQQHVSEEAVQRYRLKSYPPGTVLLAMYGQGKTRGRVALLGVCATTTQNAGAIEPLPRLDSGFLWHFLSSQYEILRGTGNLGHLSHLNLGYVRDFQIPLPPIVDQIVIRELLSKLSIAEREADQRIVALRALFTSTLHLLMTGQVRVPLAGDAA